MEEFALLGVGLILAVPVSIAILFMRQRKLGLRLEALENYSGQNDALHREFLELKRQLANLPQTAMLPSQPVPEIDKEVHRTVPEPALAISQPAAIEQTATREIAVAIAKPPEMRRVVKEPAVPERPVIAQPVAPRAKMPEGPLTLSGLPPSSAAALLATAASETEAGFCTGCGAVHPGGSEKCPIGPAVLKSAATDPRKPPRTEEEKIRAKQDDVPPAREGQPSSPVAVLPAEPKVPGATVFPIETPAVARVAEPPQFAAFRGSSAGTPERRVKSVIDLEETLGRNWLNKLGITLLVLGVASFGIYELGQIGPAGRVLVSYAVAAGLLAGGVFLERRERYRILGHTLIGGGWALLFFTTYAVDHVDAMRVLTSETADLDLMLAVAAGMVVHTLRYRSQLVTGLSFLLGYSTVALSHDTVYSLSACVVLAIGLVSIVLKMGWFELEVFGILSSYLSHFYWLYRTLGPGGAQGHSFPDYHTSIVLLFFYWATFRVSYVVRRIKSSAEENISTIAALLNTLLLLGTMKFQSVHPELAFQALLAIGAIEFTIAQLPVTKRRREAFVLLTIVGTALMVAAVPFRYSGNNVSILWLVGAEALLLAGAIFNEIVFRRLGLLAGLLVGGHLAAIDLPQLMAARRTGEAMVLTAGVTFALCAVVFYLNAFLVPERWRLFTRRPDPELIALHSYTGAFAALSATWALCSNEWTALVFAGTMMILAGVGRTLKSGALRTTHLQVQYGVIGCLALYRIAVFNLHTEAARYTHVPSRLVTLPILAAMFYLTAKWAVLGDDRRQRAIRDLFAFVGTALVTGLINFEVPEFWQPFAAIMFAVILFEFSQKLAYSAFAWHARILSALAIAAAVTTDPGSTHVWHSVPLHALTALPVVAGLYWIAKRTNAPGTEEVNVVRAAYEWAGTGLMAWVLFEATPDPWVAVTWIAYGVALALLMRRLESNHLAWQANALAAAAIVRTFTFNYTLDEKLWAGLSLRLTTVSLVAAGLYFLSRKAVGRGTESALAIAYLQTISVVFSWAATALVSVLMWYELEPLTVALGWAVFGLVLFEYGLMRNVKQFRFQSYAALSAAFGRIFFSNLPAASPGGLWGPRMYTVLPITLILFLVYWQIGEGNSEEDSDLRFDTLLGYLATSTVVALVYFQLQNDWLVAAWASVALALFAVAFWLERSIFLHQALLVTLGAVARGIMHNLFGASYFTEGTWTGRFLVLGSGITILLACLPFAFQLRGRWPLKIRSRMWLAAIPAHPEQFMFFAPVALLTLMLALKMRAGMVTVAWGLEGLLIVLMAIAVNERSFRLTGLTLLLVCVGKVLVMDAWGLAPRDRYLTFIILGAALLAVSFLYSRYREMIRQFL